MTNHSLIIRQLGCQHFESVWQAMRDFTDQRTEQSADEIWLVEHPPIFTLGQSAKAEHILDAGNIPIVITDRGGQVTYHGPGQLIAYILLDLSRRGLGIRRLITLLEQSVIQLLAELGLTAVARADAPGVYIENKKICSIGLRVRRGRSYHGIALNVAMDLEPFSRINPCGHIGMQMTQVSEFNSAITLATIQPLLVQHLILSLKS